MADANEALARLLEYGITQLSLKFSLVACATFAIAECLHCLPLEVSLIWGAKWNLGKGLYLLSRYLTFVELLCLAPLYTLSQGLTVQVCQPLFAAGATITVIEVTIAEAILFLRVYALSGRDRRLGAFLLALYLGVHGAIYAAIYKFLNSLVYIPSPFPAIITCLPIEGNNKMLSNVFILLLSSELVILLITFWLCFIRHKATNSPLVATFSRDGLYYFLLLSAVSTGNIICNLVAPIGYIYLLTLIGSGVYDTHGEIALESLENDGGKSPFHSMHFAAATQGKVKESITTATHTVSTV
ncbi:hypothetical protein DFP72DRAFT_1043690 [Ephemerocybe angulata]|uniref:DUF6533 domain-containing protein n=1 Tax=Ephemerocybe angulata TaxID=980116 RepID=A0A8H6I696_9AGAR|nr:hypothetical protein DFP72DRAFT_1043690 [Tulosesus angulatus]